METIACHYNVKKGDKTLLCKKHVPVSFGIMRIVENPKFSTRPYLYHGKDVIKQFITHLEEEYALLQTLLSEINHPISMTEQSRKMFKQSSHCALCGLKFSRRCLKMRDHNHLLTENNFRFALCNSCNLNRACLSLSDIPIVFHNLSGFDGHLTLADLHKATSTLGRIRVVPHNTEIYLSFSLDPFKFIDSFKFLPTSLKVLVRNLREKDATVFVNTRKLYHDLDTFDLITRKQPYPYSFVTSLADYDYPRLPDKIYFRDELKGNQDINEDDYGHAQIIYKKFRCKTFLDFHKLYLKLDVTFLVDVFEMHRKLCLDLFELDVTKYLSKAHFSFDAVLKCTKIQLELLPDVEMYCLIESGIRAGVSVI